MDNQRYCIASAKSFPHPVFDDNYGTDFIIDQTATVKFPKNVVIAFAGNRYRLYDIVGGRPPINLIASGMPVHSVAREHYLEMIRQYLEKASPSKLRDDYERLAQFRNPTSTHNLWAFEDTIRAPSSALGMSDIDTNMLPTHSMPTQSMSELIDGAPDVFFTMKDGKYRLVIPGVINITGVVTEGINPFSKIAAYYDIATCK